MKTWTEKFQTKKSFEVKRVDKKFADMPEGCLMLIATPQIIDNYIHLIPKGKSVNLLTLRKDLALEYQAENMCPLTTGIFLRIVAEAAFEALQNGRKLEEITPFWRVIDKKSPLLKKLSFGKDFILNQRKIEGLDK
jgi:hypothetical protein